MKCKCEISIFDELKVNMYCCNWDWIQMLKMTHGKDVMSKEKHFKPVPKNTFTPPEPKRAKHKLYGPR